MKLTNEQIQALARELVDQQETTMEGMAHKMFGTGLLDDTSIQTLSTLVSQCPFCGEWTRLEDGDTCLCSQSDAIYGPYDAWSDGLRELPEE
jgi:hypothetical protein